MTAATYRAEVDALIAAGFLTPAQPTAAEQAAAREAREGLARFRQQWQAMPAR